MRLPDVIDLEYHADELSGEKQLLFLAMKSLKHVLVFHVISATLQTVNSQSRIVFCDLSRLDLRYRFDWTESRIFRQCHGDVFESSGERMHGVLFNGGNLIRLFTDSQCTRDLRCSSSIHDTVVTHQVTNNA